MVGAQRYKDKVVVITGASSGIGRTCAQKFAAEGAAVIVSDINDDGGEQTVKSIRAADGEAHYIRSDISNPDDVEWLVKTSVKKYGRLDVFFNNAGVFDGFATSQETSDDLWHRIIGIDLSGSFFTARAAFPHLAAARGNFLITSSVCGFRALGAGASYTAAKHGILGLLRHLANEFASAGVRVNAIAPGPIHTHRNDARTIDWQDAVSERVPLGRWGQTHEVAEAALFLASDAASFITGVTLPVDGGWLTR